MEALIGVRIMREIVGEKLECDEATEFEVFGLINNAHAPTAEPLQNAVVGDRLPSNSMQRRHGYTTPGNLTNPCQSGKCPESQGLVISRRGTNKSSAMFFIYPEGHARCYRGNAPMSTS
jgi:hypothetical protein